MRKTGVVRRIASRTHIEPVSAGSTVGKMKLFRKIIKEEQCSFEAVIGVGRFESPKRIVRRYINTL